MSTDLFGVRVLDVDPERLRIRLRIFVVYYDPAWGTADLLPHDPSFFCRVLWEGADLAGGQLADLVAVDEVCDERWVDRHTHRFVSWTYRVATRNHPLDEAAWKRLAMFYPERQGSWPDEHLLSQGDYDVQVTDSRWLTRLSPGQSWGTTFHDTQGGPARAAETVEAEYAARAAGGDPHAAFVLGWLRQERGDIQGAIMGYRQAAEAVREPDRPKVLRYLGDLYAAQGDTRAALAAYEKALACGAPGHLDRHQSRAALGLGTALRAIGEEHEAKSAYAIAGRCDDPDVVREARRLAGIETVAELVCRHLKAVPQHSSGCPTPGTAPRRVGESSTYVQYEDAPPPCDAPHHTPFTDPKGITGQPLRENGRDAALAALAEAGRGGVLARLVLALAGRQFDSARAELAQLTDPAEREDAAAVGFGLAFVWKREKDEAAVDQALDLVMATGRSDEGYRRAMAEGLIETPLGNLNGTIPHVPDFLRLLHPEEPQSIVDFRYRDDHAEDALFRLIMEGAGPLATPEATKRPDPPTSAQAGGEAESD